MNQYGLFILALTFTQSANSQVLMSRPERIRLFETLEVTASTRNYDELAQDLLIFRISNIPLSDLAKMYPKIPIEKLKALKAALEEKK